MNKIILLLLFIFGATIFNKSIAQKPTKEILGNKFFSLFDFDKAIEYYTMADSLSINGKRNLAQCYSKTNRTNEALQSYLALVNTPTQIDPEDFYNIYSCLNKLGKYEDASVWMEKFVIQKPNDLRTEKYLSERKNLIELLKDRGAYKITQLEINTDQEDFGTSYWKDKVIFASTGISAKIIERNYNWNNKPFLDLFMADVKDGQLINPKNFNKAFNKKMHEGPASFAKNGTLMALTRNNYQNTSKQGEIKLEIVFSELKNDRWVNNSSFNLNSSEYSVGHAALSEDGNTMYFVSDMIGGFGGTDIYVVKKDSSNNWNKPENLGSQINTEGNEMFPFLEEKNNLFFFASDGHYSIGGLDVFMSRIEKGHFSNPFNLGNPINSQGDDFSFIIDSKLESGYFSSNRSGGKGDDDIYRFDMNRPFYPLKKLKGVSKDINGNVLANVSVNLFETNGQVLDSVQTSPIGEFMFSVNPEKDYYIVAAKENYINEKLTIEKDSAKETEENIFLKEVPPFEITGMVLDPITNSPIDSVNIKLSDLISGSQETLMTDANGSYTKKFPSKYLNDSIKLLLVFEKSGCLGKEINFDSFVKRTENNHSEKLPNISLARITTIENGQSEIAEINPIYFELGKYTLTDKAQTELEKIVVLMNENPSLVLKLKSYTDCRGTKASNKKLSNDRAQISIQYIQSKINNSARISGKGYGELSTKFGCKCENKMVTDCSDDEFQANRITRFIIVKNK